MFSIFIVVSVTSYIRFAVDLFVFPSLFLSISLYIFNTKQHAMKQKHMLIIMFILLSIYFAAAAADCVLAQ